MLQLMHCLRNMHISDEAAEKDLQKQFEQFFLGDESAMEDAPAMEEATGATNMEQQGTDDQEEL